MKIKLLCKKAIDEKALSLEESVRLDAALEATQNSDMIRAVKNLGDDEPSLMWRSSLNTKLVGVSSHKRTKVVWTRFAWAAACGCAFILTFSVRPGSPPNVVGDTNYVVAPSTSIEDTILADHQDAVSQSSLGVYISYGDAMISEAPRDEPSL